MALVKPSFPLKQAPVDPANPKANERVAASEINAFSADTGTLVDELVRILGPNGEVVEEVLQIVRAASESAQAASSAAALAVSTSQDAVSREELYGPDGETVDLDKLPNLTFEPTFVNLGSIEAPIIDLNFTSGPMLNVLNRLSAVEAALAQTQTQ